MLKRLFRHPGLQVRFVRVLGAYLSFTIRTTKWQFEGMDHLARYAVAGSPLIIAFWHDCLPLMPALWLREQLLPGRPSTAREAHILVSQHRDGQFVGAVMQRFGVGVVQGSSSRGGAAGLRQLIRLLGQGHYVVITPDGPRGPRHVAAPGVAQLAALSQVAVLPCAAQTTKRFTLDTWDKIAIPRPFARGAIICEPAVSVDRENWSGALATITAALDAAAERADRLCA
ncbi:MAG: lysophospholipid acyltransferase family protein [Acetobacteraceae bacterium]|nr:lysophospholipid acyltransferase family protein [Acetobacteraceae bacterium]